jgi:hypothetical protein
MTLLEKLDKLSRVIFGNIKSYGANECRVAALVPLVEESQGIYKYQECVFPFLMSRFIVSMMTAMHMIIGSVEVLAPLRVRHLNPHHRINSKPPLIL